MKTHSSLKRRSRRIWRTALVQKRLETVAPSPRKVQVLSGLFVGVWVQASGCSWPPRLVQTPVAGPHRWLSRSGEARGAAFSPSSPGMLVEAPHSGNAHPINTCVYVSIFKKANASAFFTSPAPWGALCASTCRPFHPFSRLRSVPEHRCPFV